jgi:hypothetical protein
VLLPASSVRCVLNFGLRERPRRQFQFFHVTPPDSFIHMHETATLVSHAGPVIRHAHPAGRAGLLAPTVIISILFVSE